MAEADAWVMIPKLDKDKTGCIIDVRPLVLCKECWKHDFDNCPFLEYWDVKTPDNWFCADGKRAREAEE